MKRIEEAIACFDKAIEMDWRDSMVWNLKGFALYGLGRFDEAIARFDKSIEIDWGNAKEWTNNGFVLFES